jgi:cytochrome c556
VTRTIEFVVRTVIFAVLLPTVVSADDQDVIDYREHIMNTLNEQAAALGMILSTAVPGDNMAAHLQVIALTAQIALKAFEPKVAGGEAKPEVWSTCPPAAKATAPTVCWGDFSRRMNEFAQRSAEAAALAKGKSYDDPALSAKIIDALSCKSCHEIYRNEKKK